MKNVLRTALAAGAFCLTISAANAQDMADNTVMVGGEAMYPKKTIVDNAVNSKAHTTLVAAVQAAGLVQTLKGEGPFTVFAPVNDAFENLPAGTVETLLKPENKKMLTTVLTYHVVSGKYDFKALSKMIKKGKGKAMLKTVAGGTLTLMMNGAHNIVVKDESGNIANVTTYDVYQSNGVIHSIDTVLLPKS
ncbi:MAG: fasciclin domain-containing protein [Lewinellaceae bacterium]|nr:fasciclin domain-containing protein [Lewinellaceae bacterium]